MLSLCITTFMLVGLIKSQKVSEIRVGQVLDKVTIEEGKNLYLRLAVGHEYVNGTDLILKAIPLDDYSDPDIYISKENKFPNTSADSEWQCASYGRDTCTIHHSDVKDGDIFNIGIVCPRETCFLQIMSMTSAEFLLEDGVEFQTQLLQNEARIFRFQIPAEIKDDDHIIIQGSSLEGQVHDFTLSVSTDLNDEKDLPSSALNNRKSIPAWKRGQVMRLSKENFPNNTWCKGCELKILMDIQEAGYYRILAHTSEAVPKVFNGDLIDDIVGFDQRQCYSYFVKDEESDFQVTLTTYTGKVFMKFSAGSLPESWDDMFGHPQGDEELIMDLRSWFRKHRLNQAIGTYYVCVKGESTSTYSLKFKEVKDDWNQIAILEDSYAEMFGIWQASQRLFLYKVPKLEYTYEDIKIEFTLQPWRGEPDIYAAFCTKPTPQECIEDVQTSRISFQGEDSPFSKGINNGQFTKLIVDHDEKKCDDLFNGTECYYVIVVHNPNSDRSRFRLHVSHNQNNHIILQERTPQVESVEIHQYKYFKFSILEQDIQNISFDLGPLHGDSDILISRNNSFPTKEDFEKKSSRSGGFVDHVTYSLDENTTSLVGTYYIGVYGYSYSTYSLVVNINRSKTKLEESEVDERYMKSVTLYQGVPLTKYLRSSHERFYGQFNVYIADDENQTIVLTANMLENGCRTYIKYGEMPTSKDYDITFDGSQSKQINSTSEFYHRNGTYYIMMIPDKNFLDIFIDRTYSFSITWRLVDKIPHLNSQGFLFFKTENQKYSYFKHFLLDNSQDIKLSLVTQGHQDIFVSINNNNTYPKKGESDFTTQYQTGGNFSNGKTLLIPIDLIKQKNPSCQDLGYSEDNKCIMFIGIFCNELKGCSAQIELEYDTKKPKRIYAGQSKHSILSNNSFANYFMRVTSEEKSDIFAVLQIMQGQAYIEYSFQRFDNSEVYSPRNNRSIQKLNTQTIKIKGTEIQSFFNQSSTQIQECQLNFKIIPVESSQSTIIYNFAVYSNVTEVQNKQAIYGSVGPGEYQYFLYKEYCANCTMIVSISGQSSDALELVMNRGTKLPTIKDYNIIAPSGTQLLSLNLNSSFFTQSKIDTMEGNYVIAVYGIKESSFLLTITSEKEPIISIGSDVPLKHSQDESDIIYYQYYHWSPNDIQISLQVQQGIADLLVQTFSPNDEEFISKLPSDEDHSTWVVETINSTNLANGKELLILQEDRDFCVDCYYLIGVRTQFSNAMYTLTLNSINDQKNYKNLLRVGDNKFISLQAGQTKIYQFILESEDPAQIVPTVIKGSIRYYLGFREETYQAFHHQTDNEPIDIGLSSPDKNIHPDQNYYLLLEATGDSEVELYLQLQQKVTFLPLYDGVPQTLYFHNKDDATKNLQFNLPSGTFTVLITVRSKTKNFYPQTRVRVDSKELRQDLNISQLSPLTQKQYSSPITWDRDQYIAQSAKKYTNLKPGNIMTIILKYNMFRNRLDQDSQENKFGALTNQESESGIVIVTVTYSQIIKIIPGEEHFGQLQQQTYSFLMFQIDPPEGKITEITYSNCVGQNLLRLVKASGNPEDIKVNEGNALEMVFVNGKRQEHFTDLKGLHYLIVDSIKQNEAIPQELQTIGAKSSEFTIMVKYLNPSDLKNKDEFISIDGGHISFEPVRQKRGEFKLSWQPVNHIKNGIVLSDPLGSVRYKLAKTKNQLLNLDQVCAIKRSSDVHYEDITVQQSTAQSLQYQTSVEFNQEYQLNIIAIVEDKQIVVPYKPLTLNVPSRTASGGRTLFIVILISLIITGTLAIYCCIRNIQLTKRLRTELRDVQQEGDNGPTQTYRKVDGGGAFGRMAEETE